MKIGRYRSIAGFCSLYLFFCTIVVSIFFVAGNVQAFLESTNRLLLGILEWIIFAFIITNIYYLLFFVIEYLKRKKKETPIEKKAGLIWACFACTFGIIYLTGINAVVAWL